MPASNKKIGKWIQAARQEVLGLSQPEFARWLTRMTGESVTSKMVARMENYGNEDACNPQKPSQAVKEVLEEVAPQEISMLRLSSEDLPSDTMAVTTSSTGLLQMMEEPASFRLEEFTTSIFQIKSLKKKAGQVFPTFDYEPAVWYPGRLSQIPQDSSQGCTISSTTTPPLPRQPLPSQPFRVRVVSENTSQPISEETSQPIEYALVSYQTQGEADLTQGKAELTDSNGEAVLDIQSSTNTQTVERLIVYAPLSGYWSSCQLNVTLDSRHVYIVRLNNQVLVPDNTGIIAHQYGLTRELGEAPVLVGVVDTGIDAEHEALNVVGGHPFFQPDGADEPPPASLYIDNNTGHGTHVAGLIGSSDPNCLGMAPEVQLMSYRVFPDARNWADKNNKTNNQYIAEAIERAIKDDCDIINLSLGIRIAGVNDDLLRDVCKKAFDKGCLVVAAAGNKSQNFPDLPAAFREVLGISAMGREGTVPANSVEHYNLGEPISPLDPRDRFARFSNYCNREQDIQYITPGVGIISTIPGGGFGVMSGTSMACPIVSGIAANLLSHRPDIYSMARDRARTEAIIELLNDHLYDHQFGLAYQGAGRPMLV